MAGRVSSLNQSTQISSVETPMSSVVVINQRARSAEQKALRRHEVLSAAEIYFQEVGYEAFSMAQLATKTGIAKGTLYLFLKPEKRFF